MNLVKLICMMLSLNLYAQSDDSIVIVDEDYKDGFCDRMFIMSRAGEMRKSAKYGVLESADTDMFKSRLVSCNLVGNEIGYPAEFFTELLQESRLVSFKEYEESYLGREASSYQQLIEMGTLAGMSVSDLENKHKSQVDRIRKQCSPSRDQRKRLPPVRDQDSTSWCYAFAAADLVSFKLGKNISAADIALAYGSGSENKRYEKAVADSKRNSFMKFLGFEDHKVDFIPDYKRESMREGGLERDAINFANKEGYCLESKFSSEGYENSVLKSQLRALEKLRQYSTSIDHVASFGEIPGDAVTQYRNEVSLVCEEILKTSELFPGLDANQLWDILKVTSIDEPIKEIANRNCEPRIKEKLNIKAKYNLSVEDNASEIHSQLEKNNIVSINFNLRDILRWSWGEPVYHASSIVGRRWSEETKTCELLLRNSWGTGCSAYKPGYECDEGSIWVPEGDLLKSTYGVTYDAGE